MIDLRINSIIEKLSKSKFRSKFNLKEIDLKYIDKKGIDVIEKHAEEFVLKRLSPAVIINDGKQTPMHGHPVFIAQHATATCCRGCLYKWHHIPKDVELNCSQQQYVVAVIMRWIEVNMKK